ncbi:MAG: K(+)-transporting ATPase subunit C [Alphaproteobacteria bacterium]|nr:K(+)-transporting ATPase subunit C [Alphaproteobacteria bacterium]
MQQDLRASFVILGLLGLLTGIIYPLVTLGVGQLVFPYQSNGSLIEQNGKIMGSTLIGQKFAGATYFHSRPSAANYAADASGGSNLPVASHAFYDTVAARAAKWRKTGGAQSLPADLVTASASGLDPDISVANALYQAPLVASARGLPLPQLDSLIARHTEPRAFGFIGEERVNVLALNRALDTLTRPAP